MRCPNCFYQFTGEDETPGYYHPVKCPLCGSLLSKRVHKLGAIAILVMMVLSPFLVGLYGDGVFVIFLVLSMILLIWQLAANRKCQIDDGHVRSYQEKAKIVMATVLSGTFVIAVVLPSWLPVSGMYVYHKFIAHDAAANIHWDLDPYLTLDRDKTVFKKAFNGLGFSSYYLFDAKTKEMQEITAFFRNGLVEVDYNGKLIRGLFEDLGKKTGKDYEIVSVDPATLQVVSVKSVHGKPKDWRPKKYNCLDNWNDNYDVSEVWMHGYKVFEKKSGKKLARIGGYDYWWTPEGDRLYYIAKLYSSNLHYVQLCYRDVGKAEEKPHK